MTNKSMLAGIVLMEVSGLAMFVASLIPGGSQWAAGLVFAAPGAVETVAARLGTGIGGALMVGWAVTLWLLLRSMLCYHCDTKEDRLKQFGQAVLSGIGIWFVLDCVVSIALGAPFNVVFNLLYVTALGGPAWGLMRAKATNPTHYRKDSPQPCN